MPASIPLSHCQQGYLMDAGGDPADPVHHTGLALLFEQPLKPEHLRASVALLIERHLVLRTTIQLGDATASQCFVSELADWWQECDATGLSREALIARAELDLRKPFEMRKGVFRATLYVGAQPGLLLLLTLHHIANDAPSFGILGRDLLAYCQACTSGTQCRLPPVAHDYRDYVQWEHELLASAKGQRMRAYWEEVLGAVVPVLDLPTDWPRPALKSFNGEAVAAALSATETKWIHATGAALNSSRFAVLLTAYLLLLHTTSGQSDVWVLIPTSMPRQQPQFAPLTGMLVSPLIVRLSADTWYGKSFSQLVRAVNQQLLQGLYHQPYPVTQLLVSRLPAGTTTAVRAMSAFERSDFIPRYFEAENIKAERLDIAQLTGLFDIGFTFLEETRRDGFFAALSYNRDLFSASTADVMFANFRRILHEAARDAEQPLQRMLLSLN